MGHGGRPWSPSLLHMEESEEEDTILVGLESLEEAGTQQGEQLQK